MDFAKKTLDDAGVAYKFVTSIKIDAVDFKTSQNNQARLSNPIVEETKNNYKVALENGDVFDAVILEKVNNKYIVLDGNHRLQAAREAGFKEWSFGAYVVIEMGSKQKMNIIYTANIRHGLVITNNDRIAHAIFEIENGAEAKMIAKKYNIAYASLNQYAYIHKGHTRAATAKITNIKAIADTCYLSLNSIKDDDVFALAVKVCIRLKMTTDECKALVLSLKEITKYDKQMAYLNEYMECDIKEQPENVTTNIFRAMHAAKAAGTFPLSIKRIIPNIAEVPIDTRNNIIGELKSSKKLIDSIINYLSGN